MYVQVFVAALIAIVMAANAIGVYATHGDDTWWGPYAALAVLLLGIVFAFAVVTVDVG